MTEYTAETLADGRVLVSGIGGKVAIRLPSSGERSGLVIEDEQAARELVYALLDLLARREGNDDLDGTALGAAHVAVENALIELRDMGCGVLGPANGFIVNNRDGSPNTIMRLGTRDGLAIGIRAYLATREA